MNISGFAGQNQNGLEPKA